MIIGIDFSGKIGQFPLIIVAVRTDDFSSLEKFERTLKKRGLSVKDKELKASRIKPSVLYLFAKEVDFEFSYCKVTSTEFFELSKPHRERKDYKFHILSALIFKVIKPLVKRGDEIFIHNEYEGSNFPQIVRRDLNSLGIRFLGSMINVNVSSAVIKPCQLADLVAGSIRKKLRMKNGIKIKPEPDMIMSYVFRK
jgi:hypothetical protein